MPRLDCISILEAGSFGSDSGTVVLPSGENQFPNHINIYPAVGSAAGIGTAAGVAASGSVGTAAGIGAASAVGSVGATHPLDGVANVTGAYSFSRDLLTAWSSARYTDTSGAIDSLKDQSGNARDLAGVTTGRPTLSTAGPNSIACGDFDGSNDKLLSSATFTDFVAVANSYMIVSFLPDAVTANSANTYENDGVMGNDNAAMGIHLRNVSGSTETVQSNIYAGAHFALEANVITVGTPYVVELWHTGSVMYFCVNNGTPQSNGVGDGQFFAGTLLSLGHTLSSSTAWFNGKIFEAAVCNAVPASRSTIAADFMAHVGA